jgi:hypothetical protein
MQAHELDRQASGPIDIVEHNCVTTAHCRLAASI